jgi:alpha-glucosidase
VWLFGQGSNREIEITLSTASPQTVRVQIQPIENGQPVPILADGAPVEDANWSVQARVRAFPASRTVKCGDLTVKLSNHPRTVRVESKGGALIQKLQLDPAAAKLTFAIGDAPLRGLGEGGPQFDRRGNVDRMASGQGGFRLATHGGRVPIQLAIGTSGWAMYTHRPMGRVGSDGQGSGLQFGGPGRASCRSTCL